jgi:hypothetical protein
MGRRKLGEKQKNAEEEGKTTAGRSIEIGQWKIRLFWFLNEWLWNGNGNDDSDDDGI